MNLKILLPFRVFEVKAEVSLIVVETPAGAFGLWPRRLDCVASLVPGILTYETEADGEVYLAVDEGVLVKTGPDVLVSVRRAMGGTGHDQLRRLRDQVAQEFLRLGRAGATRSSRDDQARDGLFAPHAESAQ